MEINMAKPKWLMKPIEMYETEFGFSHEGPGVIYDYEKSSGLSDTKISFFVLTKNPKTGKHFIMFDSKYMNMQSIRRNVEVYNDFFPIFKKTVIRSLFEHNFKWNTSNIKMASDIISKIDG